MDRGHGGHGGAGHGRRRHPAVDRPAAHHAGVRPAGGRGGRRRADERPHPPYRTAAREATGRITGMLGETFGSVQSIRVAGAEQSTLAHFRRLNDQRRKDMVRDRVLTATLESVFWNTVNIGIGLILILGASSLVGRLARDRRLHPVRLLPRLRHRRRVLRRAVPRQVQAVRGRLRPDGGDARRSRPDDPGGEARPRPHRRRCPRSNPSRSPQGTSSTLSPWTG